MKKNSLLELLHPDGHASTSFVLGSNCPENLLPELTKETDQEIALLVIAPTADECRFHTWLEHAAIFANRRLAKDGVCYLLVPPPWRPKLISLLTRSNLVVDTSFWHFPNWLSSYYIVPLEQGPAQFAVDNFVTGPSWKRMLARGIFRNSSAYNFLRANWNPVGVSLRRPGARPHLQWLFDREHGELHHETAIIRKSWRDHRSVDILYCFADNDSVPSAIVKTTVVRDSQSCLDHEAEVLDTLGPVARSAGVQVPHILLRERNDRRSLLSLAPVRGKAAADLLAENPRLFSVLLPKIVDWLERWHLSTTSTQPLNQDQLQRDILNPMQRLAPMLRNADAYRDWLADRVQTVIGTSLPFVATHNDLTMANILINDDDDLGVIDWETGRAAGWPLVDFHYAITDAVRIAGRYSHRLDAFKACYDENGIYRHDVDCWEKRLRSATGLSSNFAVLCFHACWLHHACNEHESSQPGEHRPFLDIVQWLALNYASLHGSHN